MAGMVHDGADNVSDNVAHDGSESRKKANILAVGRAALLGLLSSLF